MKIYTLLLSGLCIALTAPGQNMNLRINEVMASNNSGQLDDFFEHDDWIEIYNPPGSPITNLAGYYLSDRADSLDLWQIPSTSATVTTLLFNDFMAFWIDDDASQGENHTGAGFKLSGEGETIFLVAPDGQTIIDSITYPVMAPDVSYGRVCDGCADWMYFNNVTFEDNNGEIQVNDVLYINEVQTVNTSTFDDPQHDFDQWFEIFNPNAHQVNLANYYLSINGDPLQWHVPADNPYRTVIPAGGHLLIWCDNETGDDSNHAPFALPLAGATIVLTGPDGTTNINTYIYGVIPENQSYGRQTDGSATSIFFTFPTPTVSNSLVVVQPELVYINEVMSANQTDTLDNAGENEDWFEIYNPNNFSVNLAGYYVSDDVENPMRWLISASFPDSVTVQPHDWLLFWADADVQQGVRHADFRLSNNGEYLGLFSPDGFTVADEIDWGYIAPDISFGRQSDGGEPWIYFSGTTPEYSNESGTVTIAESVSSPISVYPNPCTERVYFNENLNIILYNISGEIVASHNSVRSIDVSGISPGMYILRTDKGKVVRLVKN